MKVKLYFTTLKGEKKFIETNMRNVMGGRTFLDFVASFKRYDHKIKEDFVVVVFNDDDKIIHKESIHVHWVTNPKASVWNYGITLCGNRCVSNVSYGRHLPVCSDDRERSVDVQKYDKDGNLMYDKYGFPITEKHYLRKDDKKIKEASSNEFPKGVLYNLSKIDYNI